MLYGRVCRHLHQSKWQMIAVVAIVTRRKKKRREENAAVVQNAPMHVAVVSPTDTGPVLSLVPWRHSVARPGSAAVVFAACFAKALSAHRDSEGSSWTLSRRLCPLVCQKMRPSPFQKSLEDVDDFSSNKFQSSTSVVLRTCQIHHTLVTNAFEEYCAQANSSVMSFPLSSVQQC